MFIFLPSSLGIISTLATSSRSVAKRSSRISPCSLKTIERPRKKKKAKELKANQVKVVVKEIRFGPQTDDHDYNFKLKHAMNFLKEGSKVKAYVFFCW